MLETYRRDYPQGEYAGDVTRKLAVAYVEAGRGELAAAEFERIAAAPGEDPAVVREALGRAAELYDKAGNGTRTVALLEQLVQKYPTPVGEAIETRQRLADLAAKAGNSERQRYWQREIVSADAGAGAQRSDRTRFLAANAQLALTEPVRDAFRAVRLTAPLKQSLAAKKRGARDRDQRLQGRRRLQCRGHHHGGDLRDRRAVPHAGGGPARLRAPEEAQRGRARAVRCAAGRAGVSVRGAGDPDPRDQRQAHAGWVV